MSTDLADEMSAFIAGDEQARRELPTRLQRRFYARARVLSPHDFERRQLIGEVVSRTWELLVSKQPGSYDPLRSGPLTYASTVMRTAVRDVRSSNLGLLRAARDYSDVDVELSGGSEPQTEYGMPEVDERLDLEVKLSTLDEPARKAARLIAFEGEQLSSAARRVGLSRFALKRQLKSWAKGLG